ncbi:hypothetical protein LZ31DRAFT_547940 [Colletotrichum somersetense]|nr:hypothetical protein LZ31DRAFT_547940 [Colletotrichum somersetense]
MSAQIEYNQMPSEPAPAVLSGQKVNAEQPVSSLPTISRSPTVETMAHSVPCPACPPYAVCPRATALQHVHDLFAPELTGNALQRPNQPMTMDQTTHLRGGEAGVSRHLPPSKAHRALRHRPLSSAIIPPSCLRKKSHADLCLVA